MMSIEKFSYASFLRRKTNILFFIIAGRKISANLIYVLKYFVKIAFVRTIQNCVSPNNWSFIWPWNSSSVSKMLAKLTEKRLLKRFATKPSLLMPFHHRPASAVDKQNPILLTSTKSLVLKYFDLSKRYRALNHSYREKQRPKCMSFFLWNAL